MLAGGDQRRNAAHVSPGDKVRRAHVPATGWQRPRVAWGWCMTDNTEAGDQGTNGTDSWQAAEDVQDEGQAEAVRVPADSTAYDPLRRYDPQREFGFIETARAEVDQRLARITGPFAAAVLLLVRISAFAVVWAAGFVPLLESVRYLGAPPPPTLRCILILGIPGLALLTVVGWLLIRLPIKLRWAAVRMEMYLDDEISNKLIQEGMSGTGELTGTHHGSNSALLKLLRLRMKAFHFWHRISIHTFLLNGMFFRRVLETPFLSPRLWANGVPVMAVVIFLSVQIGLFLGGGGPAELSLEAARSFMEQVWGAATAIRIGAVKGEGGTPVIVPMLLGFVLAFGAYWLARRARFLVMRKIEPFLNTDHFLTPYTHDYSRNILAKHNRMIRIFARLMARGGRNGPGTADDTLWSLILEDGVEVEEEEEA